MANHPLATQGTLNRLRASVVVSSYPALNVSSSYMGKNFVNVEFEGDFAQLIETATGAVTSPEPYVFCNVTIDLLRTQSLSSDWLTQATTDASLGDIAIHPDTTSFQVINISDAILRSVQPGVFDGQDPVVRAMVRGVFYLNDNLWLAA